MVHNIQQLKEKMIRRKIARGNNFVGCTEEEIVYIENKYGGTFPQSYREIISLIGYDAGYAFDDNLCGFFIDQMVMCIVAGRFIHSLNRSREQNKNDRKYQLDL
jgi:hypothetical protein